MTGAVKSLIADVAQATPARLTTILREQGCLDRGAVVTVRKESPYFSEVSVLSRLTLDYSSDAPAEVPARLLLKISKVQSEWPVQNGPHEVDFYTTIVKVMRHAPVVRCYDAVYCSQSGRSHLLLDDLSATHFEPEWPIPPSNLHCDQLIDCIAGFHAFWWDHPRLGDDIGQLPHDESVRQYYQAFQGVWSGFVDFLGDRLPVERRNLYEHVLSSQSKMWQQRRGRFTNPANITLIHGDLHFWNVLYPRDPQKDDVCLIDWEDWRVSVGTDDLACMIALHWYPERRRRMESNLLRRYHANLLKHGIIHYDWEDCWRDYRLSVIRQLFVPVWLWFYELPPAVWWSHLERVVLAFEDLHCAELLES